MTGSRRAAVPHVAVLGVALLILVLAGCTDDGGSSADEGPDATRRASGIEAGDCYQEPEDERAEVDAISCDGPHDNEAFAAYQLPDGEYPGDRALLRDGVAGCLERFAGFVGIGYADSALDVDALTPTRLTWEDGDRKVVCVLFRFDGEPLRGTAQGSRG
jgi:hypothetical protein